MKKILYFGIIPLIALAAVSCQKSSLAQPEVKEMVFSASMPDMNDTKTVLETNSSGKLLKLSWLNGDIVSVNGDEFTAAVSSENHSLATLTGTTASASEYYAYFPAKIYDKSSDKLTLPDWQRYHKNNKIDKVYPMVAQSTDGQSFSFKNICGLLEVTVTGKTTDLVKQVVVSADKALAGEFTVSNWTTGKISLSKSGGKSIVLRCSDETTPGVALSSGGTKFFIAVAPGTYRLSFDVVTSDGRVYTKATNGQVTVSRNTKYPVTISASSATQPSMVDLGLSVYWATCNIGASSPGDYGNYYAWGEVETKTNYSWSNYLWGDGTTSDPQLKKYNDKNFKHYGVYDNKTVLDLEDDIAYKTYGGQWHMPTMAQFQELYGNCTFEHITGGWKFTSKKAGYTDRSIVFPYSGYYDGTTLRYVGDAGFFWSSSLSSGTGNTPDKARIMNIDRWILEPYPSGSAGLRSCGYPVRPVANKRE